MKILYFFFPTFTLKTLKGSLLVFLFAFGLVQFANAQVIITENFDTPPLGAGGVGPLPNGWSVLKISGTDPNNDWDVFNPYGQCCPFIAAGGPFSTSGTNCARYSGFGVPSGNAAGLVSIPFDMSGRTGAAPFSFEMFRNLSGLPGPPTDNIQVYANTIPSLSAATLLNETGSLSNIIHREWNLAPNAGGFNQWFTYNYNLPAAFNTSSTYIIIAASAAAAHHIYIDDFTITTWPSNMTYVSSELFFQNTANVASGSVNAMVVGMNIEMDGSLNPINCDSLLLIPTGTTDLANISNAKVYYTGNNSTFSTATQYGATVAVPGGAPVMRFGAAAFPLVNGNNYFWLTYDVNGPAGNFVDADFFGSKLSDAINVLRVPIPASIFGAREIGVSYCIPTLTVGTAWANYTNNDYVASVQLIGEIPGPIINSNVNTVWSSALPCAAGTCPFTSHPPDYEAFTPDATHTTILKEGGVYFPLSLQVGTWFSSNYIAAWIDWNGDGDFNDVIGGISEKITQSGPLAGSAIHNATVTVPAPGSPGLINGNTVLRVREVYATSNINPCQNGYTYGETEDFVITISPDCPVGVKTWLGFTNDWNNPANWCDQIPTLADIAVIPGKSGTPGYVMPKIEPGVNATAKTLRIESPDTVYVDASSSASLTIADSMIIRGTMQIESGFQGTCQQGNGVFTSLAETPFLGSSSDAKIQLLYTAGELIQCGILPNDVITEIHFSIFRRRNLQPYNNFTIKYYHTSINDFVAPVNAPNITPITTVYTNVAGESLNPIPNLGSGTHPIVLNGAPMVWNGIDNIIVEICFDKAAPIGFFDDIVYQTRTIGRNSVLIHRSNPSVFNPLWAGCGATGPFPPQNYPSLISEFRPNLIFKYDRPYSTFPINQGGHWENNGVFNAGLSNVIVDGAINQDIAGTSPTTFYELTVNKPGVVRVDQVTPITVSNTLRFTSGVLDLNQQTLTVSNSDPTAVTRTGGSLLSESLPPTHGVLKWDIGNIAGPHTIPFGNILGTHIPFSVNQTGGSNIGSIEVATYPSMANNTPYPVGVTHMNGPLAAGDNSANTVDRFWLINQAGAGAINADLTFSYANIEEAQLNANDNKRPQRWITVFDHWENASAPGVPYVAIPAARSVTRTGVTSLTNDPWTISNDASPLPIELITFDAVAEQDRTNIWWVTASEINVDHFKIDRTLDGQSFDFIDQVASNSPTSQIHEYQTYDNNPLTGLQYYRLTTVNTDGSNDYSNLVPVYFGKKGSFNISSVYSSNLNNIQVYFEYDTDLPISYILTDALGKVLAKAENQTAKEGTNLITINTQLSQGIYFITIANANDKTSKHFVY